MLISGAEFRPLHTVSSTLHDPVFQHQEAHSSASILNTDKNALEQFKHLAENGPQKWYLSGPFSHIPIPDSALEQFNDIPGKVNPDLSTINGFNH